jgi:hypothetical protein
LRNLWNLREKQIASINSTYYNRVIIHAKHGTKNQKINIESREIKSALLEEEGISSKTKEEKLTGS